MRKKIAVFLVVLALVAYAAPAMANDPTDATIIGDVLLARPLGLAMIAAGSVLFVVSLPVAIPSRSVGNVGQRLVLDPVEFTFIRPVGNFDYTLGTWLKADNQTP